MTPCDLAASVRVISLEKERKKNEKKEKEKKKTKRKKKKNLGIFASAPLWPLSAPLAPLRTDEGAPNEDGGCLARSVVPCAVSTNRILIY